jgi:hypothetical protein
MDDVSNVGVAAPETGVAQPASNDVAASATQESTATQAQVQKATLLSSKEPNTKWFEDLSDEFKSSPMLKGLQGKDINDLAKSYMSAVQKMGEKASLPGEGATPEQWNEVWQKLGKPADKSGYEFKAPEGVILDEAQFEAFKDVAFDANLTKDQAATLAEWKVKEDLKAIQAANERLEAWKEAKGAKVQTIVSDATKAIEAFVPDVELRAYLAQNYGGEPAFLEMMASIGRAMTEPTVDDRGGSGSLSPQDAQSEIQRIMYEAKKEGSKHPIYNKLHPEHQNALKRWNELNNIINSASSR